MHLMLTQPAIIRRPVLDTGRVRHVGFSEETYCSLLQD
jgi:arsenate reductase-like glutaredoxin family protein